MENTEINDMETPSYMSAVFMGALVAGLLLAVLGTANNYLIISSEPTGSPFSAAQGLGIIICFLGGIGGILANRSYAKDNNLTYPIGKGALIGLLTGIFAVIVSTVLTLFWNYVIDPGLTQAVYDWGVANIEATGASEDVIEQQIALLGEPGSVTSLLFGIGFSLVGIGIINTISGLIGAKVFASED